MMLSTRKEAAQVSCENTAQMSTMRRGNALRKTIYAGQVTVLYSISGRHFKPHHLKYELRRRRLLYLPTLLITNALVWLRNH
jgi:hypothetical protein